MTLTEMKDKVRRAGYTPSAGCWEDERKIFAFSVESHGAATFGHPVFSIEYRKDSGELMRENNIIADEFSPMLGSPSF